MKVTISDQQVPPPPKVYTFELNEREALIVATCLVNKEPGGTLSRALPANLRAAALAITQAELVQVSAYGKPIPENVARRLSEL